MAGFFLKVGIHIDVETWEKREVSLICVCKDYQKKLYLYIFEADPNHLTGFAIALQSTQS